MCAKKKPALQVNADRKTRFIEQNRNDAGRAVSIFRALEKHELAFGKDTCELSTDELQQAVNQEFGSKERTWSPTRALLKHYVSWCQNEGYKVTDAAFHVKFNNAEKMRRCMVGSPAHLAEELDKIFSPLGERGNDCVYRCFLWMAFSGLIAEEALEVTVDEVDFDNMLIRHNGRVYEIYREAVPALKMGCSATHFVYYNENYGGDHKIERKRVDSPYVMRGVRSGKIAFKTAKGYLTRKFKDTTDITYNNVLLSGQHYRIYEKERVGKKPNFDEIVHSRRERREENENVDPMNAIVNAKAMEKDIKKNYQYWKEAFS